MFNKIKDFIKYTSIGGTYLIAFNLIQSLSLLGIFTLQVFLNEDFGNKFMEILGPIYSNPNYLEDYGALYKGYMELFTDIIGQVLLLSNLIIVIIFGIKLILENKKRTFIKKIETFEVFKYIVFGILLNLMISLVITFLPQPFVESHSIATSAALSGNFLLIIISSGIIAPISEELIFRYGMMKNFEKINVKFAIIYQALLFGLLHGNLVQSTYAFILGLIFGTINHKKGNILYSIIIHISINTSSVIVSILGINEFIGLFLMISIISILCGLSKLINYLIKKET